jgi:hypothetical protein
MKGENSMNEGRLLIGPEGTLLMACEKRKKTLR